MENCLQTKPSSTPATPPSSDAWEDDALDAEIERVEKLISSLFLERSKLYRKRNEMRSPIYSLPQEILTLIFKFMCPPPDFLEMYGLGLSTSDIPHPRIIGVLAAVSVRWHNLVLSKPSLWASFPADDQDMNAMRTICARSGNLPVVASLEFPHDLASHEHHATLLAPVLRGNTSRIHMLHAQNASHAWLKEHIPRFANLEFLCLDAIDGEVDESDVMDGSFTGLILKDVCRHVSFPWSQIKVLHLSDMAADDCLELLTKCIHLREFRLRDSAGSASEGEQLPSSPFILPCLELFEWEVYEDPGEWQVHEGDPAVRAMMQYIRMPALRTLVWNQFSDDPKPSSHLSTFFEHLPSTLSAVELQHCALHSNFSIFSYIMNLSSIEQIISGGCSNSFMDSVFSNLGSETRLVDNQEIPVLPNLKSIYVDSFDGDLDQAKILKTFQRNGLQPLESPPRSPFRLEFAKREVDWTPEFKEELIRMVEEGYKVELWEDSERVDWLPRVKLPPQ